MAEEVPKAAEVGEQVETKQEGWRILHQAASEGCALTAPVELICCFVHNPTE